MAIQESGQMYLETILILSEKSPNVRAIDVCEYMGFSKPSVSRAIGLLKAEGYVLVNSDGYLVLTPKGVNEAQKMYDRHKILTEFLMSLGVSKEVASADACKIEHHISDESFSAIKANMEQIGNK